MTDLASLEGKSRVHPLGKWRGRGAIASIAGRVEVECGERPGRNN